MKHNFLLNPKPNVKKVIAGNEEHQIFVVDDFLINPAQLLDCANEGAEFQSVSTDYYPGIRKQIDGNYAHLLTKAATDICLEMFGLSADVSVKTEVNLCAFSMATTAATQLRPIQSLPHFDTSNPSQFAVIHYLCSQEHGGTSFYRHRKTGFEGITENRVHTYLGALKQEVVAARFIGQRYMNGDNEWFERYANVEAKFNRAVVYQGNLLHSGDIKCPGGLGSSPKDGRLTANTFITIKTN